MMMFKDGETWYMVSPDGNVSYARDYDGSPGSWYICCKAEKVSE
jgi:hypothetical protein